MTRMASLLSVERRRSSGHLAGFAAVVAAGWIIGTPAAAQTVAYTGSVTYSTGKYVFDQRSDAVVFHNGLGAMLGRFRLNAGIGLVWQNSSVVSLVGDTWIPTGGPDHGVLRGRVPGETVPTGKGRRSGQTAAMSLVADTVTAPGSWEWNVGDPLFSSATGIWSGFGALRSIELTAATKPPIASIESGVGTGAWDWSAGASAVLAAGRVLVFGDASYWWNGDMPDLELVDGFSWGASAGVPIGGRLSLLGSITGSEAVVANVEAPLSLTIAGAWSMGDRALQAGFSAGLSESSPDLVIFGGWRVDLFDRRPVF